MSVCRFRRSSWLLQVAAIVCVCCSARVNRESPAIIASSYEDIIYKPVQFPEERIQHTLRYRDIHSDKEPSIYIEPRVVVVHWTATRTFEQAFAIFDRPLADPRRSTLFAAGLANVAAHFLVDVDGTIYQLMPENWFGRHCIGLNHTSIGIENVGGVDGPLTNAQLEANVILIERLMLRYPGIETVIGHYEAPMVERSRMFIEQDPNYRTIKVDPGVEFMRRLRLRLNLSPPDRQALE